MAFDPWAGANQGIDSYANSMLTIAQLKREDKQQSELAKDREQSRTLASLQTKAAQQTLDDQTALRTALASAKGGYLYPEPAGVGPYQPGPRVGISALEPQAQPAGSEDRLAVMADLASRGNTAAMELYGKTESLTQKLAEHKAQAEAYGDAEGAAKADIFLKRMKAGGEALDNWMKVDPSGELARQQIAANPGLFNGMDPSKMQIGDGKTKPPAFFPAPDGGYTYHDGKEWKHVKKEVEKPDPLMVMDKRFEQQQQLQTQREAAQDKRTFAQIEAADRRAAQAANGNSDLSKIDFESAKTLIRTLPKLKEEAISANSSIERIDSMQKLIKGGLGGKKGQVLSAIAPYAEAIGVDTKAMNDAQLYELMAKTIGGSMRMQIVGPGPVSNYENQLLQQISGGGKAAPAAASELLGYYRKVAKEKVDDYNGSVDSVSEFSPATGKMYKRLSNEEQAAPKATEGGQFVKQQYAAYRKAGVPEDQIRQRVSSKLRKAGWKDNQITAALRENADANGAVVTSRGFKVTRVD